VYTYHEKRHRLTDDDLRMCGLRCAWDGWAFCLCCHGQAAWEELSGDTLGLDWTAVKDVGIVPDADNAAMLSRRTAASNVQTPHVKTVPLISHLFVR
jgi:hypothetical protein